ncbi:PLP-dependent aminotransferase family protein [Streptomyces sp. NPDC050560]|uniref:PLP-dependent aminotransferase family protein n=1 Tax=Streptomyces sp. NPDC050560 TaxID=3365630 RepID=UPI0037BA8A0E
MEDYRLIADELAADIAAGRLRPGQQLLPQRAFARRRGIAGSTAGRVYRELVRRGLITGEVGRGSFVRARPEPQMPALTEPSRARVDLELNHPVAPGQAELMARALGPLLRADALEDALRPCGAAGTPAARAHFAALVGGEGRQPAPEQLLFAGNGRQLLSAALTALVGPGERLGVEALTYPMVKAVAHRLGIRLVPLPVDAYGLRPETLAAAHRSAPLRALYVQPRGHNPLGGTLPEERREALARELRRLDLVAVEDAVWSFLVPWAAPLSALAPERVITVDSLSKRLAAGLTTGFAVVPRTLRDAVAAALRSGGWTPGRFALEAGVRWLVDGTVAELEAAKREDARERGRLAAEALRGHAVRPAPHSYYRWWELPAPWRAETFVAAAERHGIAVTPAAAFAVGPHAAPSAVRLGLASPPLPELRRALTTLAHIARGAPEDFLE